MEDEIGACRLLAGCYEHYGKTDLAQRMLLRLSLRPATGEGCCQLGKNWLDRDSWRWRCFGISWRSPPRVSGGGFDTPDCPTISPTCNCVSAMTGWGTDRRPSATMSWPQPFGPNPPAWPITAPISSNAESPLRAGTKPTQPLTHNVIEKSAPDQALMP